jgi:hypothetical protein
MAETFDPDRDPMDLDTAVAVLRGTATFPITAADMEKAIAYVLAELERLRARVAELEPVEYAAAQLLPIVEEGQNEVAVQRAAAALRVAMPGWADVRTG